MEGSTPYASALGPAQNQSTDIPTTPPPLVRVIEALLFAGGQPLDAKRAATVIRGLKPEDFERAIEQLARDYRRQNRPYGIETLNQGYTIALRTGYRSMVERMAGPPREARLSKSAIDVLALIAFKQPLTRAAIDTQRGSDSASIVRQLIRLGLIVGQPVEPGSKEQAYVTTPRFLHLFGLRSLDDLPQTHDLQQL